MTIYKEVTISEDIDIDIGLDDIYNNLTSSEKEDLLEMLLEHRGYNSKNYFIESLFLGKSDSAIIDDKNIWDKLIRLIKYSEPALKNYLISELSYEPPKQEKN